MDIKTKDIYDLDLTKHKDKITAVSRVYLKAPNEIEELPVHEQSKLFAPIMLENSMLAKYEGVHGGWKVNDIHIRFAVTKDMYEIDSTPAKEQALRLVHLTTNMSVENILEMPFSVFKTMFIILTNYINGCLLYTSPSPRDS